MIRHQHIPRARRPPAPSRGRKDPISGLAIYRHLMPLPEELGKLRSHWSRRPGFLGLQSLRGFSVDPCATYVNTMVGVIDVLPLESDNFRKPQPGGHGVRESAAQI